MEAPRAPGSLAPGHRCGRTVEDAIGYCVWLGSLPLGLALLLALEWLLDLDFVLVAVLCAVPLVLWARFVWTRVVKPLLARRKTTVEALR